MSLIVILGPMKSGKSFELIARVAPYKIAGKKVFSGQSSKHTRDNGIESRAGLKLEAKSLKNIKSSELSDYDVIAIDEIHMFGLQDIIELEKVRNKATIIVSGLDLDYRGKIIPPILALYELKPDEIIYKNAVCERCQSLDGAYTQITTASGKNMTEGLPPVVPEDGNYEYLAVCHRCFVKI